MRGNHYSSKIDTTWCVAMTVLVGMSQVASARGRKEVAPRGLAMFAQQGQEEEALIDELLGDDALIQEMQF